MTDDPGALLRQNGKLLRHFRTAKGPQLRALEALRQADVALERAHRACLAEAKRQRQAQRLLKTYRIRVLAALRSLHTGRSTAALARLGDAELLALAQAQRGQAQLRSRAGLLRWAVRELGACQRRQERAGAALAKRVRGVQAVRGRLAKLGL